MGAGERCSSRSRQSRCVKGAMMNVGEVIRTMHWKSGLAYERISTLAGCEVTFLERALREGRDMRVDDFCGIAEN